MSSGKRRIVYSTDPDSAAEGKQEEVSPPGNPAGPYRIQGGQPVRVHRSTKGRGGKVVSVIDGVKSPQAGKKALLKLLKTRLGTGGAVRGDVLEIQGEQREQIVSILNELGYKAKVAGG